MDHMLNTVIKRDCIAGLEDLPADSIDLVFADPPFNIGYEYDVYEDSLAQDRYVDWSREWIRAVHRVLKAKGTFWLAIGDEFAAELKLASQEIGFHHRSWVIWYYTFGVNCSKKFSRSHAHLFHFVKDPQAFTFRDADLDNRIPSARQLVYNDKRANPKGRLPDDTWIIRPGNMIGELTSDERGWEPRSLDAPNDDKQTWTLRPQDLSECFAADEDTWFFPRVAGTFKERAGFHGCQMPEQLLGRIIRTCSNDFDCVLDPFSGSATTLVVAKKLGRQFIGFDISEDYVKFGLDRLQSVRVGDRLEGSPEPLLSAPKTGDSKTTRESSKRGRRAAVESDSSRDPQAQEQRYAEIQLQLTLAGVREAFRMVHDGFSADRVVADPQLNTDFIEACAKLGLCGDPRSWNTLLFRLRKSGKLADLVTRHRTQLTWEECDRFLFASEIALQQMLDEGAASLDEILCDPEMASRFDQVASGFAPGFRSLDYRWTALKIRKQVKLARSRGAVLIPPARLQNAARLDELDLSSLPDQPGVYVVSDAINRRLYIGEALNLRDRLMAQFGGTDVVATWNRIGNPLQIQLHTLRIEPSDMLSWQSCFVRKYKPRLNFQELSCISLRGAR